VLSLAGISFFSIGLTDLVTRQTFAGAAVYVFGGSLVTTGLVQVVLTRYLADEIYRGEYRALVDTMFPVLAVTAGLLALSAIPVLVSVKVSLLAKALILALYVTIGCLWITVVFASSAHHHQMVVITFLTGGAVALGAGLLLLSRFGLEGLLFGYAAGHTLMLVLMMGQLIRELGYPRRWDWGFLRYMKIFPALIAIGSLQGLGVWVDKFIFWTSDLALEASGFVTAPKYDSSTFLGFLTAVPAMVHFFVRIEADFSEQFHRYYDEVFFRSSYERIQVAAKQLRDAVLGALLDIMKIQGMVTFLAAFFGVEILTWLGLPVSQIGMFRFGVIGSLFLVFMLFSNVVLLYLDCQREVLMTSVLFFAINAALTAATLRLGYQYYGLGFATACLVGLVTSVVHLTDQLYNLEFMTFATKPLLGQRRAARRLKARAGGGGYGRYNPLS
jgi:uncharacterized membrane protein